MTPFANSSGSLGFAFLAQARRQDPKLYKRHLISVDFVSCDGNFSSCFSSVYQGKRSVIPVSWGKLEMCEVSEPPGGLTKSGGFALY